MKTKEKRAFYLSVRYLVLLAFMFSLPIIYWVFTPLTVYPTAFLLDLFYQVSVYKNTLRIYPMIVIELIPACIAGSAYLLSLILNLSVSMKLRKRLYSILFAFASLFILNIIRIFLLSIMFIEGSQFFDFTHKLFWYGLSTLFVVGIWFLTVKLFHIKEIPVYSDFKYLWKNVKLNNKRFTFCS